MESLAFICILSFSVSPFGDSVGRLLPELCVEWKEQHGLQDALERCTAMMRLSRCFRTPAVVAVSKLS